MKRFLILLAAAFVGSVVLFGAGFVFFRDELRRADPYPTFMADYESGRSHSYEEAKSSFSDFVVRNFPIGSDAKDAIAKITNGGFRVTSSEPEAVELLWKRHNGPCGEQYSIVVSQNGDGKVAKIIGRLNPACL